MISGDAYALERYRIEWRLHLSMCWVRLYSVSTHTDALDAVDKELKLRGGQVRAVAQHVIMACGLGAGQRPMSAGL